jgi:hypothetical protein
MVGGHRPVSLLFVGQLLDTCWSTHCDAAGGPHLSWGPLVGQRCAFREGNLLSPFCHLSRFTAASRCEEDMGRLGLLYLFYTLVFSPVTLQLVPTKHGVR